MLHHVCQMTVIMYLHSTQFLLFCIRISIIYNGVDVIMLYGILSSSIPANCCGSVEIKSPVAVCYCTTPILEP